MSEQATDQPQITGDKESPNVDETTEPEHEVLLSQSPNVDETTEPEHEDVSSHPPNVDETIEHAHEVLPSEGGGILSERVDYLFQNESEETVLNAFHDDLHQDKDLFRDKTLLHRAVEKKFFGVAELFLEYGVDPLSYDSSGKIPLSIAIDKSFDEMAALLVSKLPNFVVRRLFGDIKSNAGPPKVGVLPQQRKDTTRNGNTYDKHTVKSMFNIKKDLILKGLDKTLLLVLDSFIEEQQDGDYTVHVKLLDTDDAGKEPGQDGFERKNETTFQTLARLEKKEALNHQVIREYVEFKWKKWFQKRYLFYGCLYLFSLFCLTYSAVSGVTAPDVLTYDTPLQYSRAVMEVISYLYALVVLFTEIRQIIMHKRHYFAIFFNFMELFSAALIILVLPFRYTHVITHWYVFALGYLLWATRIFKYANLFSQSGVYIEAIKRVLLQDFVQFSILLLLINLIFSGTFLLVLKADDSLLTHIDTSTFHGILYVGVRTLIEAASIVDYTGSEGYRFTGTICMLVYMFFTIVVMLNILIAQFSETYSRTHDDCIKTIRANRACIIARAMSQQGNLLPMMNWRPTKCYQEAIENVDMNNMDKDPSNFDDLSRQFEIMRKHQIKIGLDIQTMKKILISKNR